MCVSNGRRIYRCIKPKFACSTKGELCSTSFKLSCNGYISWWCSTSCAEGTPIYFWTWHRILEFEKIVLLSAFYHSGSDIQMLEHALEIAPCAPLLMVFKWNITWTFQALGNGSVQQKETPVFIWCCSFTIPFLHKAKHCNFICMVFSVTNEFKVIYVTRGKIK